LSSVKFGGVMGTSGRRDEFDEFQRWRASARERAAMKRPPAREARAMPPTRYASEPFLVFERGEIFPQGLELCAPTHFALESRVLAVTPEISRDARLLVRD
jgi:hypothetical protein